jgi:hypothetical protein
MLIVKRTLLMLIVKRTLLAFLHFARKVFGTPDHRGAALAGDFRPPVRAPLLHRDY